MRATVLHAAGDLRLEEVPMPEPGPGELLLHVETVGVCGTDVSEYSHGPMQFPLLAPHPVTGHVGPMIPGHEFSGRVEAVGPDVSGFDRGDLVASAGSASCGTCDWCRMGRASRCARYWAVGLHRDGALAEYCAVPASTCVNVDSLGLTPDLAVLAQPMSIAVHALRRGGVKGGENVVVVGVGGIGSFVTYAAAAAGCEVTSVDLDPDRLALASTLGATRTVTAGDSDIGELGAAVVFEITGSEAGLRTASSALGPGGRMILVGFQTKPLEVDLAGITGEEQEWVGTNRIDPAVDLPQAVQLLSSRNASWSDVAPVVRSLDEVEAALRSAVNGEKAPIKTLFSPRLGNTRPSAM